MSPILRRNEGQNIVVNPGHCIIADLNGVVCLLAALAGEAITLIPAQVEADERIAKDLQAGIAFTEASKKHRVA